MPRATDMGPTRSWLLVAALILAAWPPGSLCAQDALPPIEGRVLEWGGARGLADAAITIERYAAEEPSSFVPRTRIASLTTDAGGAFRFVPPGPGAYRVSASKEGYGASGGILNPGSWTSTDLRLGAGRPAPSPLRFLLSRPGSIAGRIVDRETEQPVAGLRVVAWEYGFVRGLPWVMPGGAAVTSAEGAFRIGGLTPTNYVLGVEPQIRDRRSRERIPALQGAEQLLSRLTSKEAGEIDTDYDLTYWPGPGPLADAAPLTLGSGAELDAGPVWIARVPKHRVRVSFSGEPCQPGETSVISFTATRLPALVQRAGSAPCGEEVLLRGFPRGDYQLEVESSRQRRGTAPFSITGENVAVTVPLSLGVTVEGRVTVPEDHRRPAFEEIKIALHPLYRSMQNDQIRPGPRGEFHFDGVLSREFDVRITNLPPTHYVRRLRYNGIPLAGTRLLVAGDAAQQRLEIELSGRPAGIEGVVTGPEDRLAPDIPVLLVSAAAVAEHGFVPFTATQTDGQGRYRFAGLAPGAYRIVAVPAAEKANLQSPYVVTELLRGAERAEAAEGQTLGVPLTLRR